MDGVSTLRIVRILFELNGPVARPDRLVVLGTRVQTSSRQPSTMDVSESAFCFAVDLPVPDFPKAEEAMHIEEHWHEWLSLASQAFRTFHPRYHVAFIC
jgi:hypothetical protein